jgi:hypothetical protein
VPGTATERTGVGEAAPGAGPRGDAARTEQGRRGRVRGRRTVGEGAAPSAMAANAKADGAEARPRARGAGGGGEAAGPPRPTAPHARGFGWAAEPAQEERGDVAPGPRAWLVHAPGWAAHLVGPEGEGGGERKNRFSLC